MLRAYRRWGDGCVERLRGMFAFAIWDEARARRCSAPATAFGIKPLYYAVVDGVFYFASEAKALLPFLPAIETDLDALKDYLTFQFCLAGKTLFRGRPRAAARPHADGPATAACESSRYWEVYYELDFDHTERYFDGAAPRARRRVGAAPPAGGRAGRRLPVSGGLDSSIVAALAARRVGGGFQAFTGTVRLRPGVRREPRTPAQLADAARLRAARGRHHRRRLRRLIRNVIYHLDYPVGRARARSRSTWSRSWRRSTRRSCSAARAATRSSAATPAT